MVDSSIERRLEREAARLFIDPPSGTVEDPVTNKRDLNPSPQFLLA
jgi:hypothetical protein